MKKKKILLTIAGSDPSGGAGIQTDIRTASEIGLYPCSVITCITAQNTNEVKGIWSVGETELKSQLETLLEDIKPDAVKIGLLTSSGSVDIILEAIEKYDLNNIVVDPVLSTTLSRTTPEKALAESYINKLFPVATLITPNIPEKQFFDSIANEPIENICEAILVKGGHSEGNICVDKLLFRSLDKISGDFQSTSFPTINNKTLPFLPHDMGPFGEEEFESKISVKEFRHKRIKGNNTHGSGCVLSTAIACFLAEEYNLERAVESGLKFTYNALRDSSGIKLGKGGYGPTLY